MWNIVQALQQTEEFKDLSIVFVRFNPHYFKVDDRFFDMSLREAHEKMLQTIENLKQEEIKPGVNLIYINYDQKNGKLCLFEDSNEINDYAKIFRDSVIKIV